MPSQEHERERDQTHCYWYIPSAPRVNYSFLIMEPERAPDWFFVATEACGGGTPDLGFFLGVLVFIGIFGVGLTSRGLPRDPQAKGARPRGA